MQGGNISVIIIRLLEMPHSAFSYFYTHNNFTEKFLLPVLEPQCKRVVNEASNTLGTALLGTKCDPFKQPSLNRNYTLSHVRVITI